MSSKGRLPRLESDWRLEQEAALVEMQADLQKKQLSPITDGQAGYFAAIQREQVILCSGPSGTGKTHIAVGRAAQMLSRQEVQRIVLTRPLVQCGPGYGFRKGDFEEKISPFFRPMLDALSDFMSGPEIERRRRERTLELLPLEDMRGTTLRNSFVICDEAQNAEYFQLHMLLTRYGPDSKFVVTGDVSRTQVDLRGRTDNPFRTVLERVRRRGPRRGVGVVELTRKDIVRHDLVQWLDETLADDFTASVWRSVKCPHCGHANWYDAGDEADPDYCDSLGVVCWHCGVGIGLWGPDDEYLPHATKKNIEFFARGRKRKEN